MSQSTRDDNTGGTTPPADARYQLACPRCKARYILREIMAGRRVRCRHCGHVWRDESREVQGIVDALGRAASGWSQVGSSTLAVGDPASALGYLVAKSNRKAKPPPSEYVGRQLGRYKIKAVLGVGAMGYVYEAVDVDLRRPVALKVLPYSIDPAGRSLGHRMFLQEARVAAGLEHPNIVTIYEVGEADGICFFAMEKIQGITLKTLVKKCGSLPAEQACYLIAHVARALAVGHAGGVIHRDVKPGNIMIDTEGRVKVTDFGLAVVRGTGDVSELSGCAMGTPGWISPEVAREQPATPQSDIYGLGLTLYYTLTGRRLIRGKSGSGMIRQQREAKSLRLEDLPDDWPPRLRDIVVQCLQADPGDRYQSAETLAADLVHAVIPDEDDGTVVLEPADGNPPRLVPSLISGIVLILLVLISGSIAAWYFLLR
ncbi:MAG: protein kinase [Phycisphaerae bacterium]